MTYQEIINNIRDLGFSDDAEMDEFGELIPNSINRAITEINLNVAPIIERYELEITDEDTGYLYITMPDIDENFLDFTETPVLYAINNYVRENGVTVAKETQHYKKFTDFDYEANDTIVINAESFGLGGSPNGEIESSVSIRIFYKAHHEKFDGTQLNEACPLPLKAHHLVPLLAAYYVWLEDEPAKAAQYYNMYETEAKELLNSSETNVRVKVLHGGI